VAIEASRDTPRFGSSNFSRNDGYRGARGRLRA
jgi:hypothetical protein